VYLDLKKRCCFFFVKLVAQLEVAETGWESWEFPIWSRRAAAVCKVKREQIKRRGGGIVAVVIKQWRRAGLDLCSRSWLNFSLLLKSMKWRQKLVPTFSSLT
jgi:hypothetical protein